MNVEDANDDGITDAPFVNNFLNILTYHASGNKASQLQKKDGLDYSYREYLDLPGSAVVANTTLLKENDNEDGLFDAQYTYAFDESGFKTVNLKFNLATDPDALSPTSITTFVNDGFGRNISETLEFTATPSKNTKTLHENVSKNQASFPLHDSSVGSIERGFGKCTQC